MRRRGSKISKRDKHTAIVARREAKKVMAKKIESKTYDTFVFPFQILSTSATSIFDLTNGIARGTAENQYIGDSIMPTHLRIRWVVEGSDEFNTIRVMVIQNKAGGIPIGPTLIQSSGTQISPISPYDTSFNETYRVLFDEFYTTVSGPFRAVPTSTSVISGDIRIPAKKFHKINFTTGGVLSVGGLYIIFTSDSAGAPDPSGKFYSRLYYKDA